MTEIFYDHENDILYSATKDVYITDFTKKLDDDSKGKLSDGYRTFDELYYHRMILFSIICNQNSAFSWKSKLHCDGSMYPGYFIAGITTPEGNYTYHYELKYWDKFNVREIESAPEWDGHQPEDIERLESLLIK